MERAALPALLVALLVLSSGPVAAHGNHIEADAQRSADGTVVVETVLPLVDGFVVLHRATEDGGLGEPIGHTRVSADGGFRRGVPVQMNDDAWANWSGSDELWIVYHEDNGGTEFDPEEDPVLSVFGSITGTSIQVERADHAARVLAERSRPQETANATATLGQVAIGTDGYAVLRTESGNEGRVVGVTPLDAGVHENVTIPFDESAFAESTSPLGLYAQLYAETESGNATVTSGGADASEFSEADELVRAGGEPVGSYFLIRQVNSTEDTSSIVQTPSENDADVVTPTSETSTDSAPSDANESDGLGGSNSSVHGFGLLQAAVAALAVAVLFSRRQSRE